MSIDGDGKMDLLVRRRGDGAAVFFRSNGDGSFQQVSSWQTQWPYYGADEFIPGDYDGDGKTDLLVRRRSDNAMVLLGGDGTGAFQMRTSWTTQWPIGSAPSAMTLFAGDYNRDGKTDLFALRASDKTGVLMVSNGDFTFHVRTWMIWWPDATADAYTIGDYIGNGRPAFLVHRRSDLARAVLTFSGWDAKGLASCPATDLTSLLGCLRQFNQFDDVSLNADIECNGDACCGPAYGPLMQVYGQQAKTLHGGGHRIFRHGLDVVQHPSCFALDIAGSNDIEINDLIVDDDGAVPPPDVYPKDPISTATIRVTRSGYVTMHYVTVRNAKGTGIFVEASEHFEMRYSTVENSGVIGVSIGLAADPASPAPSFFTLTETTVTGTRTNGLAMVGLTGLGDIYDNIVSGNTLRRNHNFGIYSCNGYRCGGGQIHPQQVHRLVITANVIGDGECQNCKDRSVLGMEVGLHADNKQELSDVLIENNNVSGNSDCAIYVAVSPPARPAQFQAQNIVVHGNRCTNNNTQTNLGWCVTDSQCH